MVPPHQLNSRLGFIHPGLTLLLCLDWILLFYHCPGKKTQAKGIPPPYLSACAPHDLFCFRLCCRDIFRHAAEGQPAPQQPQWGHGKSIWIITALVGGKQVKTCWILFACSHHQPKISEFLIVFVRVSLAKKHPHHTTQSTGQACKYTNT